MTRPSIILIVVATTLTSQCACQPAPHSPATSQAVTQSSREPAPPILIDPRTAPFEPTRIQLIDGDTGKPLAHTHVYMQYDGRDPSPTSSAETDENGWALIKLRMGWVWSDLRFDDPAYCPQVRSFEVDDSVTPQRVVFILAKPIIVEFKLVLPDDWRGVMSVYESYPMEAPSADTRRRLGNPKVELTVGGEKPTSLDDPNPMIRVHLPSAGPTPEPGMIWRVIAARTAGGKEISVYRAGPAPADDAFGMYLIGTNGFGDTVFVFGTFAEARRAEEKYPKFQWSRNRSLLGPEATTR